MELSAEQLAAKTREDHWSIVAVNLNRHLVAEARRHLQGISGFGGLNPFKDLKDRGAIWSADTATALSWAKRLLDLLSTWRLRPEVCRLRDYVKYAKLTWQQTNIFLCRRLENERDGAMRSYKAAIEQDDVTPLQSLLEKRMGVSDMKATVETVIKEERRALFILPDGSFDKQAPEIGPADNWKPLTFSVGRVNKDADPIGTAIYIGEDMVLTAAHVAVSMFDLQTRQFRSGLDSSQCTVDFGALPGGLTAWLSGLLKAGKPSKKYHITTDDIAILRIRWSDPTLAATLTPVNFSSELVAEDTDVAVVGYPVSADITLERDLRAARHVFCGVAGIKRLQPGKLISLDDSLLWHDCSTLGGNSGSVLVAVRNPKKAIGVHVGYAELKSHGNTVHNVAVTAATAIRFIDQAKAEVSQKRLIASEESGEPSKKGRSDKQPEHEPPL